MPGEYGQQPSVDPAEPRASLSLPIAQIACADLDEIEHGNEPGRGRIQPERAENTRRPGQRILRRRLGRHAPADRLLQRVVDGVVADRDSGLEPFPIPDQGTALRDGHVPWCPVAVPGAGSGLGVVDRP